MSTGLTLRELTATARGGVSALELCGPGALECVRALAPDSRLVPGTLSLVRLISTDKQREVLDEAMLWVEGEERVELFVHGSLPLVARLRRELNLPAPLPETNLEARAWERCAHAATPSAARVLMDQAEGALRVRLVEMSQASEARCRQGLAELVALSLSLKYLLQPALVVLAGPVNAGKSTLFNLLVGRERVIVDAAQGTTRDVIRERVLLGDYAIDLLDTAGWRELGRGAGADVEREGQRLGERAGAAADLVLWLQPAGGGLEHARPVGPADAVTLFSKSGVCGMQIGDGGISISCLERPLETRAVLTSLLGRELGLSEKPWQPGRAVLFDEASLALARQALLPGADMSLRLDSMLAR